MIITGIHTKKIFCGFPDLRPGSPVPATKNPDPCHAGGMTEEAGLRFALNGGVRIAYELHERAGADRPWVCLIHGLGYGRWGWEPVVGPLAERFRVVALDNRGIG